MYLTLFLSGNFINECSCRDCRLYVYMYIYIRGVIDMGHIDISITLLKQYSLLSLVNTYRNVSKYQKHENGRLEKKLRPRRSNKMRQDPHKMVKNQHKCFMIFHHGKDSISMDISMHRIEIIEIENNLSMYRIEKNSKQ